MFDLPSAVSKIKIAITTVLLGSNLATTMVLADSVNFQREKTANKLGIKFVELDRNQDGRLSREEAYQNEDLKTNFSKVDRDANDFIDLDEFELF